MEIKRTPKDRGFGYKKAYEYEESINHNNMKFTKEQLEIIAYCLSLCESDFQGKTQAQMHQILGTLQQKGIWGDIED